MDDPDDFEMAEAEGIGIFEPGIIIDREVSIGNILMLTVMGFVLMFAITFVLIIPIMASDLIFIDPYTFELIIDSRAYLILTIAEIGFLIPPLYYIRKHGMSRESIGIKNFKSVIDVLLGLGIGVVMLIVNIAITYLIATAMNIPATAEDQLMVGMTYVDLIAWIIVMFVIVGFSEELLFRGFLQRKLEIHFKKSYGSFRWIALGVTSFIFAAMHLDIVGLTARFVLGLFLGYLAQKRNYSILGPSVAHGFNNAAVMVLAFIGV